MKRLLFVLLVAAFLGFGAWAGSRMSDMAMAVVVGVVLGAAASVPVTILLLALVGRRRNIPQYPTQYPRLRVEEYPSVLAWNKEAGRWERLRELPPRGGVN